MAHSINLTLILWKPRNRESPDEPNRTREFVFHRGKLAETLEKMRLRHAIPTAMKVAEALFHAGMEEVLSVPLLETYRSAGTVAAMYPDATWSDQLPAGAVTKDYQLVSFLAYSPDCDQPIIVAEIVVSMWKDDPFTIVKWHPNGQIPKNL